jgi:dUTP pyrophosphatase
LSQAGIHLANGIGVIDSDYRGEVAILLKNSSDESFEVTSSMRVAQLIIVPFVKAELHDMFELADTGRGTGGFGSTGLD